MILRIDQTAEFFTFLRSRVAFSLVHIVLKVLYMLIIISVNYILSAFLNIVFFEWGLGMFRQLLNGDVFWAKVYFQLLVFVI